MIGRVGCREWGEREREREREREKEKERKRKREGEGERERERTPFSPSLSPFFLPGRVIAIFPSSLCLLALCRSLFLFIHGQFNFLQGDSHLLHMPRPTLFSALDLICFHLGLWHPRNRLCCNFHFDGGRIESCLLCTYVCSIGLSMIL